MDNRVSPESCNTGEGKRSSFTVLKETQLKRLKGHNVYSLMEALYIASVVSAAYQVQLQNRKYFQPGESESPDIVEVISRHSRDRFSHIEQALASFAESDWFTRKQVLSYQSVLDGQVADSINQLELEDETVEELYQGIDSILKVLDQEELMAGGRSLRGLRAMRGLYE